MHRTKISGSQRARTHLTNFHVVPSLQRPVLYLFQPWLLYPSVLGPTFLTPAFKNSVLQHHLVYQLWGGGLLRTHHQSLNPVLLLWILRLTKPTEMAYCNMTV